MSTARRLPICLNFKDFGNRNPADPVFGVKNMTREVHGDEAYSILRKLRAPKIRMGKGKVSPLFFPQALEAGWLFSY